MVLVVMSISMLGAAAVSSTLAQRERERELLFVGGEYRRAIASFVDAEIAIKRYPRSVDELLEDRRIPNTRRHLRRAYPDPMTGKGDWELVRAPDGGIAGVRSRVLGEPLKIANFIGEDRAFVAAKTYRDWIFQYAAAAPAQPNAARATGAPPATSADVPPTFQVVVNQPSGDPRSNDEKRCDAQFSAERSQCLVAIRGLPPGSRRDSCMRSATLRRWACEQGAPLPRLELP